MENKPELEVEKLLAEIQKLKQENEWLKEKYREFSAEQIELGTEVARKEADLEKSSSTLTFVILGFVLLLGIVAALS